MSYLFRSIDRSTASSSASGPFPAPVSSSPSSHNNGAIAGGVVGGLVILGFLAFVTFSIHRRRRTQQSRRNSQSGRDYAAELQGSGQQIQEADDDAAMKTPEVEAIEWRPPAELEVVRPEMGYDEVSWVRSRPFEMEATVVRR